MIVKHLNRLWYRWNNRWMSSQVRHHHELAKQWNLRNHQHTADIMPVDPDMTNCQLTRHITMPVDPDMAHCQLIQTRHIASWSRHCQFFSKNKTLPFDPDTQRCGYLFCHCHKRAWMKNACKKTCRITYRNKTMFMLQTCLWLYEINNLQTFNGLLPNLKQGKLFYLVVIPEDFEIWLQCLTEVLKMQLKPEMHQQNWISYVK